MILFDPCSKSMPSYYKNRPIKVSQYNIGDIYRGGGGERLSPTSQLTL